MRQWAGTRSSEERPDDTWDRQQKLLEWLNATSKYAEGEHFAAGTVREESTLYASDTEAYEDLQRLVTEGYVEETEHHGWFMLDRVKT